jgi:predicted amidophosphoribosyltransferase
VISPGATIESDVHCVGCGYQLRGLRNRERCPECGTPIRTSTLPGQLSRRPARWYDYLIWVTVVSAGAAGCTSVILSLTSGPKPGGETFLRVALASLVLAILAAPFSRLVRRSLWFHVSMVVAITSMSIAFVVLLLAP